MRLVSTECTRDKRLQIQTALLFKIPWATIRQTLDVSDYQIYYAKHHRTTPQKTKSGRHAKLHTLKKTLFQNWLLTSPYHRHIPYKRVQRAFPELYASEKAIKTAFQDLNYCRRTAKKKGFSEDAKVCRQRREFAEDGITWGRERVQRVCFTNEV
jgi:ribosomal protein S14